MGETPQHVPSNRDADEAQGDRDRPAGGSAGPGQQRKPWGWIRGHADSRSVPQGETDLIRAVEDAGVMLRYAAQQGFDLVINDEEEINIAIVVQIKHLLQKDSTLISDQQETEFWKAYQQLSKRIQPVTIDSIRAILDTERDLKREPKVSKARRAVSWYQRLSFSVLFLLIVVQFYAAFGTTVISGINETEKNIRELPARRITLEAELKAVRDEEPIDRREEARILAELASLEAQKEQWDIEIDAKYVLLTGWDSFNFIPRLRFPNLWSQAPSVPMAMAHNPVKLVAQGSSDAGDSRPATGTDKDTEIKNLLARAKNAENQSPSPTASRQAATSAIAINADISNRYQMLQAGHITLEALSVFVLPLIYGLLGACAFVLRMLTVEIRTYTYRDQSDIRFRLRIYLGALAGFAVAWFVNSDTAPTLVASITPLALAFLAGYSVELVFAAMDALIDTFSRERSQAPPS
ncbi:hypothetical protein [Candidatus Entotheonella palauensis]|uniref:hypothetical protein n=1 Tax=Candidatus Entotheonella palauensis TaxID=93172 RepID=UPI000B7D576A|nr:hypothetical protein [Candidatus Entotheonella palauensis]